MLQDGKFCFSQGRILTSCAFRASLLTTVWEFSSNFPSQSIDLGGFATHCVLENSVFFILVEHWISITWSFYLCGYPGNFTVQQKWRHMAPLRQETNFSSKWEAVKMRLFPQLYHKGNKHKGSCNQWLVWSYSIARKHIIGMLSCLNS